MVALHKEREELGGVEAGVDDTVALGQGKLDQGDAGWGAAIHFPHKHLITTAMTRTLTRTSTNMGKVTLRQMIFVALSVALVVYVA